MSKWNPQKGDLFYVEYLPREQVSEGLMGQVTVYKVRDGSYGEDIFRVIAQDDRMLIAQYMTKSYFDKEPKMFVKNRYNFFPVGPDVMKALGLDSE